MSATNYRRYIAVDLRRTFGKLPLCCVLDLDTMQHGPAMVNPLEASAKACLANHLGGYLMGGRR